MYSQNLFIDEVMLEEKSWNVGTSILGHLEMVDLKSWNLGMLEHLGRTWNLAF